MTRLLDVELQRWPVRDRRQGCARGRGIGPAQNPSGGSRDRLRAHADDDCRPSGSCRHPERLGKRFRQAATRASAARQPGRVWYRARPRPDGGVADSVRRRTSAPPYADAAYSYEATAQRSRLVGRPADSMSRHLVQVSLLAVPRQPAAGSPRCESATAMTDIMRILRHVVHHLILAGIAVVLTAATATPSLAGAQEAPDEPGGGAGYVIGPEDVLDIAVWENTQISRTVPVRPDGKISLPLVNDVQAAGLTPMQLREVLTNAPRCRTCRFRPSR